MVNFWRLGHAARILSGILAEHQAVRTRAGLFDVSHMGELEIRGPGALDLVQWVSCNDASKLVEGQAHYSGLMTASGTFVDDLLVHKISPSHYLLCVNASNQELDFEHIVSHNRFDAKIENAGPRYSQLALQGPRAAEVLTKLTRLRRLPAIRYYHFGYGKVSRVDCLIARTRIYRRRWLRAVLRSGLLRKGCGASCSRPAKRKAR